MARTPTIGILLRRELSKMEAYGQKKKSYMDETRNLRAKFKKELIAKGVPRSEAEKASHTINTYRDKIFSKSTMSTYIKCTRVFERFVYENTGTKHMSLEEAKTMVPDFVTWSIEKGHSAFTTRIFLNGICKALKLNFSDYEKPARHYSLSKRSALPAINDAYNAIHAERCLSLVEITGLRRNEVKNLRIGDISFTPDNDTFGAVVKSVGKGGKNNRSLVLVEDIDRLKEYIEEALLLSRENLLSDEDMNNDADIHSMRKAYADKIYAKILSEIESNPLRREYYKNEIKKAFKMNNKVLKENLDSPYHCRGFNKNILESKDKRTKYDRVAVMFTSLNLNHFRSNTTVNYYLAK